MVDPHSPPPARTRPAVVTISSYLLILVAAIQVIQLILTLVTIGTTRDVLHDAYSGTDANGADALADFTVAVGVGGAILVLLIGIGLVVLAMLNNRGRNGARITTWVVGGILVCCTGGNLISGLAGGFAGSGQTSGNAPSPEEIQRRLEQELPSWLTPVSTLLAVVALLALLAALILLALPAANAFFRKPQQGWEPPVPGAAYPAYPQNPGYPQAQAYPQTPGYPAAPGYPHGPGQPGQPSYPHATPGPSSPDQPSPYPDQPTPGPSSSDRPDPSGPGQWGDSGPSTSGGDSGPSTGGGGDSGSSSGGGSSSSD
ncbi:IgA FC receptor precursor [Micromonospora sp. MW-13]|uniref:hypothetical protein n=1 Tax=unclassified Micromonospora TaxID=2617518 RepID=UPI000E452D1C|nr:MULTISPECIES: hypothetical protein [unclassified Micromonospora]MCX4469045.1 hypothetical protein [Micromonospora sp. NBC_01655]RGC69060.1 IgA FC receptor precursor [Micromonospora sp. MW-13]